MSTDRVFSTVVIGAGQAGLAAGYYLAQRQDHFIILDGYEHVGDAWRNRWDSLTLFTPAKFDALPGCSFPAPPDAFPTKDAAADYLAAYAQNYGLPVRTGVWVDRLETADQDGYHIYAGGQRFQARRVIVATGAYQSPYTPAFAGDLHAGIVQLHSHSYRNPTELPQGRVLVVGAGNSGVEIAIELAKTGRQVWLSGRDVGRIPADKLGRYFDGRPYWWFISTILSVRTPIGRKMKTSITRHGNPLIHLNRKDALQAGVQLIGRMAGVTNGQPVVDGERLDVQAVVWATGYRPDFSWIHLPIFDDFGLPHHVRGVVALAPGLSFVGLHFQTALPSALLGGVGKDAQYIVQRMAAI